MRTNDMIPNQKELISLFLDIRNNNYVMSESVRARHECDFSDKYLDTLSRTDRCEMVTYVDDFLLRQGIRRGECPKQNQS